MQGKILYAYLSAWVVAIVSMLGSLYFSEIKDLTPCLLCWYQRIAMYPLVFVLPAGIVRKDKGLGWYVVPLAVVGFGIAVFHYLLQMGVLPNSAAPCEAGISCTDIQVIYGGFITIPLLSAVAFAMILALSIGALYVSRRDTRS